MVNRMALKISLHGLQVAKPALIQTTNYARKYERPESGPMIGKWQFL